MENNRAPIGMFDSGIGGLSVYRAVRAHLPNEPIIFFADQAHIPYGARPRTKIRHFSETITRHLLARGTKLIVIACNTASAAALQHLRRTFPQTPFIGMEPALKPAAEKTISGTVGVLATPTTFEGKLYASVLERFAQDVRVLQHAPLGLVEEIEGGRLREGVTRQLLEDALDPMLAQGVDTIVLGCTHYPFVIPLIKEIAGPNVRVIDPAPAIAQQVGRVLQANRLRVRGAGEAATEFITSGQPHAMERMLKKLLGVNAGVTGVMWESGKIRLSNRSD